MTFCVYVCACMHLCTFTIFVRTSIIVLPIGGSVVSVWPSGLNVREVSFRSGDCSTPFLTGSETPANT